MPDAQQPPVGQRVTAHGAGKGGLAEVEHAAVGRLEAVTLAVEERFHTDDRLD